MEKYEKIVKFFEWQSNKLVGILLKRIEVLEKEEKELRENGAKDVKVLTPSLYKSLVKEIVHEHFRNISSLIEVYLIIGKVEFKSRDK